jgi:hypothetical protein
MLFEVYNEDLDKVNRSDVWMGLGCAEFRVNILEWGVGRGEEATQKKC